MTSDRIAVVEYADYNFPYYDGQPLTLTSPQWLFLLAAVAIGFAALIVPVPGLEGSIGSLIRAILFPAIPLIALRLVAGRHWTLLFRKVSGRDIKWMIVFGLLNFVVTMAVGAFVLNVFGAVANPAVQSLANQTNIDRILFFVNSIPQLLGEELLTIIPFLAIMYFVHMSLGWSRTSAVFCAWITTALIFGMVHLPSYDWNWLQCIFVIGSARLILSIAYIKTKNLWVSTGAHVFNDWLIFGLTVYGAGTIAAG